MAQFYGVNLDKKKNVDRVVVSWLERLSNDFSVFIEIEGSDFSIDFLVLKKYGIFDIEAKSWRVKEARADANWTLDDGEERPNPFLNQVLDQCDKFAVYLMLQRRQVFGDKKADAFIKIHRSLKVFPLVAISHPSAAPVVEHHRWRRVFSDQNKLTTYLNRYEWFPEKEKPFSFEPNEIENLAELLRLYRVDPRTLLPLTTPVIRPAVVAVSPVVKPTAPVTQLAVQPRSGTTKYDNPYDYTYTVTGDKFYGREKELLRVKRALESIPSRPVAIVGLQRSGKSSLARESVRRVTDARPYTVVEFDFRRLSSEAFKPEEDLAVEFLRKIVADSSDINQAIDKYKEASAGRSVAEQRQLFRDALRMNKNRGKQTVLFLDECQEIGGFFGEDRYKTFFVFLDSLCREPELGLCVMLACRPSFFELEPIRTINFGRLFESINLGPLEESAAISVIRRGEPDIQFEQTSIMRLSAITGRHAFWLQFLCHRIFEHAAFTRKFQVSDLMVDHVFNEILNDLGCRPQFYLLYQEIETDARAWALLKLVAAGATSEGTAVDLTPLKGKGSDERQFSRALRSLSDAQILILEHIPERPTARFQAEALRAWMRPNLMTL